MEQIRQYDGMLYGFYGSVAWVDRNGFSTSMLIRTGGNEKLVNCFADTDIPVVEGDWISVFGTLYPSNYTLTNEYGNQRIIDCPGLNVQDYYEGVSTYDWDLKKSRSVEGAPNLPDWLSEYWFRNEGYFNSHGGSVVLTENTINGHPYTVYRHTSLEKTAKLVLYIRFDEVASYYKENTYTVIELEYNKFQIYSDGEDGSFELSLYNAGGNLYSTFRAIEQFGNGYCAINS